MKPGLIRSRLDGNFCKSLTFGVLDNLWIVRFKDGNARVSGSKINSNDANEIEFNLVRSMFESGERAAQR